MNKSKNYIKPYVTVWIVWMVLHFVVLYQAGFSADAALLDPIVSNLPLLGLSLLLNNTFRFYQPGPKYAWNLVVWCFVMALIWLGFNGFLISLLLHKDQIFINFYDSSLLFRFIIAFILLGAGALIAWMIQLFESAREDQERHFEAQKLAKEAELNNLRQQMQPHFLFNTLNSVSALVGKDAASARKMIQELSEFLRGTIKKDDDVLIRLSDEIKHLKLYLDIEKVRFGNRLTYDILSDENAESALVPPLVLLPLIENAIKYGLYDTLDDVEIKLKAEISEKTLMVTVQNPFDPESTDRQKGIGFGLQTLKRRLFLLYGRNDLLDYKSDNNIFTCTLKIPQS